MTTTRPRGRGRARAIQFLVLALLAGGLIGVGDRGGASAAIAADFDAGNIISDSAFFNPATMTDDQIQAFLDVKGRACAAGEQPCLRNYTMATVAKAPDGICQGYAGGIIQSAAQIIGGVVPQLRHQPPGPARPAGEGAAAGHAHPALDRAVHQGRRVRLPGRRAVQRRRSPGCSCSCTRPPTGSRSTPPNPRLPVQGRPGELDPLERPDHRVRRRRRVHPEPGHGGPLQLHALPAQRRGHGEPVRLRGRVQRLRQPQLLADVQRLVRQPAGRWRLPHADGGQRDRLRGVRDEQVPDRGHGDARARWRRWGRSGSCPSSTWTAGPPCR